MIQQFRKTVHENVHTRFMYDVPTTDIIIKYMFEVTTLSNNYIYTRTTTINKNKKTAMTFLLSYIILYRK